MALDDDLARIAAAAAAFAEPGERVAGVLATELGTGARVYVCAFEAGERRSWLALDAAGEPVEARTTVRDAASLAAMCEVAADTAAGGDLEQLRADLVSLRVTESPPGIEEAEEAALALERTVGAPPRVASLAWLDDVGAAVVRLEQALGGGGGSPFAQAMKQAVGPVNELADEVERAYKLPLR